MNLIPHTLLRPRGLGTSRSIASRAAEIIQRAVDLLDRRPDFHFSVDTAWVLCGLAQRSPDVGGRIAELVKAHRMSVGMSWAGIEWLTQPEAFIRDLQLGHRGLAAAGIVPSTVVLRSADLSGFLSVLKQVDITPVVRAYAFDSGSARALMLLAASGDPVGRRDAEKQLSDIVDPIPFGEELWCPTEALIGDLEAWLEEASLGGTYSTWDGDAPGSPSANDDGTLPGAYLRGAVLPGVYGQLSAVSKTLLRAERALAVSELLGASCSDRAAALEALWMKHLEDLSGDYIGSADRAKRDELRVSCEGLSAQAAALWNEAEHLIASSVSAGEGPEGIVSLVVFNPSSCTRSEAVEADIIYYGENRATAFDRYAFYRLVDADGAVIPAEEIGGKQVETAEIRIRFVAEDVPACGYKTFYFVPKPSETPGQVVPIQAPGAMVPDFPEPTFAIDDVEERISEPRRGLRLARTFATGVFSLAVDEVTGCVDLLHRKSGRPVLEGLRIEAREDSLKSAPGTFDPTGRVFAHRVERIDLVESGEVSAQIEIAGTVASSPVTMRLRVYADLPAVDVEVLVSWRDRAPMLLELCAPLADTLTAGTADLPFSSREWTRSGETVHAQRWVTADSDTAGVRFASDRSPLKVADGEIRSPLLFSTPDPASYAYNKVWLTYPDRVPYAFRITLTDPECCPICDELNEVFSVQPVYDRATPRTRPASDCALSVVSDGARLAGLRPVEDGVEARFYDVSGKGAEAKLDLPTRVRKRVSTRLMGEDIGQAGETLALDAHQIRTIRLEL